MPVKKAAAGKKKTSVKKPKLTPKQEKFIDEYTANGGNGAKAARAAGYSEKTAREIAKENLTKPYIQERIKARNDDAASLKAEEVIGTLASHMRADITDVLPSTGIIGEIKAKGLGHLIKKIKVRREITPGSKKRFELVEIELHGSQSAAALLGKFMGLEKQPGANPHDERARVEKAIEQFMEKTGRTREDAIKFLSPHIPEVSKYVN